MIANLKYAVRNRETLNIGGGEFNAQEVSDFIVLFEDLVDQLYVALPFLEDAMDSGDYKRDRMRKIINSIHDTLKRAES